jgi:hypothetical protein
MRKLAFLTIVIVFLFLAAVPLRADDTILFTTNVSPDALIALDLSGSMGSNPGGDWNYQVSHIDNPDDNCTDEYTYSTYHASHPHKCVSGATFMVTLRATALLLYEQWSHTTRCSKLAIAKRAIFGSSMITGGQLNQADETVLNVRFGYMRF